MDIWKWIITAPVVFIIAAIFLHVAIPIGEDIAPRHPKMGVIAVLAVMVSLAFVMMAPYLWQP